MDKHVQLSLCNVSVSFKLMKNNDVFGIAKPKGLKLQNQGKVIVYFRNGLLAGLERLRYRFSQVLYLERGKFAYKLNTICIYKCKCFVC